MDILQKQPLIEQEREIKCKILVNNGLKIRVREIAVQENASKSRIYSYLRFQIITC